MKEETIIGIICTLISSYSIIKFYKMDLLNKLNFTVYSAILFIGIYFIFKSGFLHNLFNNKKNSSTKKILIPKGKIFSNKEKIIQNNIEIKKINLSLEKYKFIKEILNNDMKNVNEIYKISNKLLKENFNNYLSELSLKCKTQGKIGLGNTNYLFHGTNKYCKGFEQVIKRNQIF